LEDLSERVISDASATQHRDPPVTANLGAGILQFLARLPPRGRQMAMAGQ
jgi:hypothetical protein